MLKTIAAFDRIGEENAFAVLARANALVAQGRDIINLGIGQPDFRTPDFIGEAAIKASKDPMIVFARRLDPRFRQLQDAIDERYQGPVTAAQAKLADARFAAYGDSVYPDATFTLRISYGKVMGWTERGRAVPAVTTRSIELTLLIPA